MIDRLAWLWVSVFFVLLWPVHSECGGGVDSELDVLLGEAMCADGFEAAMGKLSGATELLGKHKEDIDGLTYDYLAVSIEQTRGRVMAAAWQNDESLSDVRADAVVVLGDVLVRLEELGKQAEVAANELASEMHIDADIAGSWRELRGYITRGEYMAAWAQYSLGVVSMVQNSRERHFREGIKLFGRFIGGGYREHTVVGECFLGMAMCLEKLDDDYGVVALLDRDVIMADNTAASTFRSMSYLRINAYRRLGSDLNVVWCAEDYFRPGGAMRVGTLSVMELEMAVEWARGFAGLAGGKVGQWYGGGAGDELERVVAMVYQYGEHWRDELGDVLCGVDGGVGLGGVYCGLVRSRCFFGAGEYGRALVEVQLALTAMDAAAEANGYVVDELCYLGASAAWNVGHWEECYTLGRRFVESCEDNERAEKMCEYAICACLKVIGGDDGGDSGMGPLAVAEFLRFLDYVEGRWVGIGEGAKVPWYRGRVYLADGRYSKAEAAFGAVSSESGVYGHSLRGMAVAAYKQWCDVSRLDGQAGAMGFEHLTRSGGYVRRFVKAFGSSGVENESLCGGMLEVGLAVAECLADFGVKGGSSALTVLDDVEVLAGVCGTASGGYGELLAVLRLEAQLSCDDLHGVVDGLDKLGSAFGDGRCDDGVVGSLRRIADRLEAWRLGLGDGVALAREVDEGLVWIYGFLLECGGVGGGEVMELRNRLADGLSRCGRYGHAVEEYLGLLKVIRRDRSGDVLRGLANAYECAGLYGEAIVPWRRLAKGLEEGREGWLEAHYHLILCRLRSGQVEQGCKLLAYFELRHGEIDDVSWRERFAELGRELNCRGGGSDD